MAISLINPNLLSISGSINLSSFWSSAHQPKQVVPKPKEPLFTNEGNNEQPPPAPPVGNGLLGHYYSDKNLIQLKLTRVDATINFDWNHSSPTSLPIDKFSVRWTGFIVPLYTEIYTFYTASDDGARLWVDNKQVINQWVDQPLTEKKGTIALIAGKRYSIRIDYYENAGVAHMSLRWSSPSQTKQVIAQSQLFSQ